MRACAPRPSAWTGGRRAPAGAAGRGAGGRARGRGPAHATGAGLGEGGASGGGRLDGRVARADRALGARGRRSHGRGDAASREIEHHPASHRPDGLHIPRPGPRRGGERRAFDTGCGTDEHGAWRDEVAEQAPIAEVADGADPGMAAEGVPGSAPAPAADIKHEPAPMPPADLCRPMSAPEAMPAPDVAPRHRPGFDARGVAGGG